MKQFIFRAIIADGFVQFLNIFHRLIFIAFFTVQFGLENYGIYVTLLAYLSLILHVDLGYSQQIVNTLTKIQSRKKIKTLKITYNNAILSLTILAFLIFALTAIILFFISDSSIFKFSIYLAEINLKDVIMLMLIKLIISLPGGLIISLYRVNGENYKSILCNAVIMIFSILNCLISIKLIGSFYIYLFLEIFIHLLVYIFVFLQFYYIHNFDVKAYKKYILNGLRADKKGAIGFSMIALGQYLNTSGIIILLSKFIDNQMIAIFSTTRLVILQISPLVAVISHAVWPEITRFYAQRNLKKIVFLMQSNSLVSVLIILSVTIFLKEFENLIIFFWSPYETLVDQNLLFFLLVSIAPLIVLSTYSNFLMAVSEHSNWSNLVVFAHIAQLLILYLTLPNLGLHYSLLVSYTLVTIVLGFFQIKFIVSYLDLNQIRNIVFDALVVTLSIIPIFLMTTFPFLFVNIILLILYFSFRIFFLRKSYAKLN